MAGSLFLAAGALFAQPEVMAWGNVTGIRVNGHLLELNTSICVAQPEMAGVFCTGREKQQNSYARSGKIETVKVQMRAPREFRDAQGERWTMSATEVVEDIGAGAAKVDLEFTSPEDANIGGAFLGLELPASEFSSGAVELIDPPLKAALAPGAAEQNEYVRATAKGARFVSRGRTIEVAFNEPTLVIVRDDRRKGSYNLQVLFAVMTGKSTAGQSAKKCFTFRVTGELDRDPVAITLDAEHPGQMFDGLGGNFRIQNTRMDGPVVDYVLDNLRVAWGRVDMPWHLWQPEEARDPRAGAIHPAVQRAMEMSRQLAQRGMPVMVSAWYPPPWAVLGEIVRTPQPDTPRGNPLNPEKMARIQESIASYLLHLKERYGVEAAMFSFNESDLGINVRQTPREHSELIKTLGAYFARKGLATKLALGDTSDANPIEFIQPALHDPEAARYIGAVDFHSWRGCTDEKLARWRDAARELNVPLVVAEGSTDAAAYRYPQILSEQSFALYEINLYLRILAIAQPRSILQWQMTADYSLLRGGGIFGESGPLRPTRRFWNLKQLASTPPRAFALPVSCDKQPNLTCAAFGDISGGNYAVHIVNNGAARTATLTGLPPGVDHLRMWVTDAENGMKEHDRVQVVDGRATFTLTATGFTTVMGSRKW